MECSRAKVVENCNTILCRWTVETVFRTNVSVNQLSIYGAVSDLCEEFNTCHVEHGDLLWQDNLTHCSCQVWWRHTYLWPMILHKKKIYCLNRKVGFEGTLRFRPVLEVTTCYLQGEYGVEIRIESMSRDHSHWWVRISHGLNRLVTNLNNKDHDHNEQETSEMQFEDFALKTNVRAFASRSKAKAKPQRRNSASSSTKTVPIGERSWTDIAQQDYSSIDYPVSKKLINLLRHGSRPREDDGAIEFWRYMIIFGTICAISTLVWWNVEEYNGKRTRKQEKISILYWSIRKRNSLSPSSSRTFRTQSHWSFTTGQCINSGRLLRVLLSNQMCNQLHPIINSGGHKLSKRQTVFFLLVNPTDKEHKDLETVDLAAPRHAWYHQKVWKIQQNTVYWVDIRLAQKKGL